MNVTQTLATSGAILGGVLVLLLQQLGALPLSELWPSVLWFVLAIVLGGVLLGALGAHVDRR